MRLSNQNIKKHISEKCDAYFQSQQFDKDLKEMKAKDRAFYYLKLNEFVTPRVRSIEVSTSTTLEEYILMDEAERKEVKEKLKKELGA